MSLVILGIGLVLIFEGLVFALLPGRLDSLLAAIAGLSRDQRRLIGIVSMAAGVILVWIVRH